MVAHTRIQPQESRLWIASCLLDPVPTSHTRTMNGDLPPRKPPANGIGPDERWCAELAPPASESVPTTASGPALISGVHSAQIYGGNFTISGPGSVHTTVINYNGPPDDILEILNSLSLPNFRDVQLDTNAKATEGTCIWFTESNVFVLWLNNGTILWGIGIRKCVLRIRSTTDSDLWPSGCRKDGFCVSHQ